MKCNEDCLNCKLPQEFCHGGGKKSPMVEHRAAHLKDGKGRDPKIPRSKGAKKGRTHIW